MSDLELYGQSTQPDGTEKKTYRYKADIDEAMPSTVIGTVSGLIGLAIVSTSFGADFMMASLMAAGIGAGTAAGSYKTLMHSGVKDSLQKLSNGNLGKPKFQHTRRTLQEKRILLLENVFSADRKSRITRELVTNRHGVWIEDVVVPIATTAVQVKSWDTVLDSIIKVHGLENLDKIASNTIPALSVDGKKLSWRRTAGKLLGEIGILEECTNRNCSTECRHLF